MNRSTFSDAEVRLPIGKALEDAKKGEPVHVSNQDFLKAACEATIQAINAAPEGKYVREVPQPTNKQDLIEACEAFSKGFEPFRITRDGTKFGTR